MVSVVRMLSSFRGRETPWCFRSRVALNHYCSVFRFDAEPSSFKFILFFIFSGLNVHSGLTAIPCMLFSVSELPLLIRKL